MCFLILYLSLNILDTRNILLIHAYSWLVPTVSKSHKTFLKSKILVIILFFIWLLVPSFPGWFYSSQRFWFLSAIGRMLISPILPVEFKDFWIADQLTSLGEIGRASCRERV